MRYVVCLCSVGLLLLIGVPSGIRSLLQGTNLTLNAPDCVKVPEAAGEQDGDEVLGVERNGEYCAYPLRMMAYHRAVNDHLGGPPILIAYHPISATGQAFDPVIGGTEYQFDAAGLLNGVPTLRDRQTRSLWSQVTGVAIQGAMKGRRMARIPCWIMTWRRWRERHPDSWVLKEDPRQTRHYVARITPSALDWPEYMRDLPEKQDRRLPFDALVLGVEGAVRSKAFPYAVLEKAGGVIHDHLDGERLVVFFDPQTRAAAAYRPLAAKNRLTFTAQARDGGRVFVDRETHSVWNIEGEAVEGVMQGTRLKPVSFSRCRWFTWSAAFPKSEVFRLRG